MTLRVQSAHLLFHHFIDECYKSHWLVVGRLYLDTGWDWEGIEGGRLSPFIHCSAASQVNEMTMPGSGCGIWWCKHSLALWRCCWSGSIGLDICTSNQLGRPQIKDVWSLDCTGPIIHIITSASAPLLVLLRSSIYLCTSSSAGLRMDDVGLPDVTVKGNT